MEERDLQFRRGIRVAVPCNFCSCLSCLYNDDEDDEGVYHA